MDQADTRRTVQAFVELVQRHEQLFYNFVHQVHSKGSDLFGGLIRWVELFINFIRGPGSGDKGASDPHGLGSIDLESCLPENADERARVMSEVDAVVHRTYRLKLLREMRVRRRLTSQLLSEAGSTKSATAAQDDAFVGEVIEQLGVKELISAQVADVEAEESDDDTDDGIDAESSDDDEPEDADRVQYRPQALESAPKAPTLRDVKDARLSYEFIDRMRPSFMELVGTPRLPRIDTRSYVQRCARPRRSSSREISSQYIYKANGELDALPFL